VTRKLIPALVLGLAGASVLSAPPAQAGSVYSDPVVRPRQSLSLFTGGCTLLTPDPGTPANVPLVENGPAVVTSLTASGRLVNNSDGGDTITASSTLRASSALTSTGGRPRSISTTFSGRLTAATEKATTHCAVSPTTGVRAEALFSVSEPTWATMSTTQRGPVYTAIYLEKTDGEPYADHGGEQLDGSVTATVLLSPGSYRAQVAGTIRKAVASSFDAPGSGSASITFAAVGSRVAGPTGPGRSQVTLPAARSCAQHNATAVLTGSARRLGKVRSITFQVDGRTVTTVKGRRLTAGRKVALPIADGKAATITATATLKSGAKRSVSARYLACTG
jgi:hypothetical protein